ncbi:MAG: tetratricopeptide repeat protein, partial [Acidobacteriaceae bacterium]
MHCRIARHMLSSIIALPLMAGVTYGLGQHSSPDANAKLLSDGLKNENQGNIRLAVKDYAAVLASGQDVAEAYLQLGILKGESGDIAGAAESFQAAIRSDPTLAEAHYNLGVTMIAGSPSNPDWSDAIPQFQDALRLRPKYPEAMKMLGVSLLQLGNAPKAIDQFKAALQLDNKSAETHFN